MQPGFRGLGAEQGRLQRAASRLACAVDPGPVSLGTTKTGEMWVVVSGGPLPEPPHLVGNAARFSSIQGNEIVRARADVSFLTERTEFPASSKRGLAPSGAAVTLGAAACPWWKCFLLVSQLALLPLPSPASECQGRDFCSQPIFTIARIQGRDVLGCVPVLAPSLNRFSADTTQFAEPFRASDSTSLK